MEFIQDDVITPDDLIERGEAFAQECLDLFTLKKNLPKIELGQISDPLLLKQYMAGLSPEQLVAVLSQEQLVAELSLEELLAGVLQRNILTCLGPDEVENFWKSCNQKYSE